MSGPKVIRIVTREEIMSTCQLALASVRQAIAEWRKCAKQYDALSGTALADVEARYRALEQLLAQERWVDVQKGAAAATAHLRGDVEAIRERAIAALANAHSKRRRLADGAKTVAAALAHAGKPVPVELTRAMRGVATASEAELSALQTVLTKAMSTLVPTETPREGTGRQRDLAARLTEGGALESVRQWLAGKPPNDSGGKEARLERLLAEVEVLDDRALATAFVERAESIRTEADATRRDLLIDSLTIELADHGRRRRDIDAQLEAMKAALLELETFSSEQARGLAARLRSAISAGDIASTPRQELQRVIEEERRSRGAAAQRVAILRGLSELGYEIRPDMATAWSKGGQMVVRKPAETAYGVELSGAKDATVMQVRLVAFGQPGAPRNVARDKDVETIWCSELGRLQGFMKASGSEILIEKARAAGETPVKVVAAGMEPQADEVVRPIRRTHPGPRQ